MVAPQKVEALIAPGYRRRMRMTRLLVTLAVVGCNERQTSTEQKSTPVAAAPAPAPTPAPIAVVDSAVADAQPPDAAEPPVAVTAKKLFADYESNEVSADAKYKGKVIEVSGLVTKVGKDELFDEPYITLAADQYGINPVYVVPVKDEYWVPRLRKNDHKIVARCRGDGMTLGSPVLWRCTIEHVYERPGSAPK